MTTVREIAGDLQVKGIPAPRGGTWHPTAVARLYAGATAATVNLPTQPAAKRAARWPRNFATNPDGLVSNWCGATFVAKVWFALN